MFRGTREYQGAFLHERRQLLQSGDEWVKVCLSLLPATNYTISVIALSNRFTANITTNTSLQGAAHQPMLSLYLLGLEGLASLVCLRALAQTQSRPMMGGARGAC